MRSFQSQWRPDWGGQPVHCDAVEPSGKGINVAVALHSHGVPALALLPSGGPAGEQLVQLLVTAGLPYRTVTITGTIRTNVSMIEADGTSSKINEPGPTLTSDEVTELLRATLDSCSSADWLAICGTLPNGFSERDLVEAVRAAYRRPTGGGRHLWIDAPCIAHRHAPTREAERA
jgi:fructose-1-phosphate kinase PfkB-like protein